MGGEKKHKYSNPHPRKKEEEEANHKWIEGSQTQPKQP